MCSSSIHIKPERSWKGTLDSKKESLATCFSNGLCLLVACCSSFKRGLPDSAEETKKATQFQNSITHCSGTFRRPSTWMGFVGLGSCILTRDLEESSWDNAHDSVLPSWAGSRIRSTMCAQAREHGRFLPPYREIFTGHAVCCMADLAITQTKMIYVLYALSQS